MTSPVAAAPTAASTPLDGVVEAVEPVIRQYAQQAEETRRLPQPVADAMIDAGLFRMFVPRELGGLEIDAPSGYRILERIAQIDSAAGWVLQICAHSSAPLALIPDEGVREILMDPRTVSAGAVNPPGLAIPVDGGYEITGRWPFASGCENATWMTGSALLMVDGQPQMGPNGEPVMLLATFPTSQAQIIDTWYPTGMRGTGSADVAVQSLFVPASRVGALRPFDDVGPSFQGPFAKLGILPLALGNAIVSLGIARCAIDDAVALAKTKVPAFQQARPVDRGAVHAHLGRAEAELRAARSFFYDAIEDAWQTAVAGQRPTLPQRMALQLAASHAADAAARAVDHAHDVAGSSAIREDQFHFGRHSRDIHTITQHALCSPTRYESIGQVMLGMETDWMLVYI
jgi:alkylation response protein AidB-like acyl-CoA dehydrogenase